MRFAAGLDRELGRALIAVRVEPERTTLRGARGSPSAWPYGAATSTRASSRTCCSRRLRATTAGRSSAARPREVARARTGRACPRPCARASSTCCTATLARLPLPPPDRVDQPPAVLVPLFEVGAEPGPAAREGRFRVNGALVIALDGAYLREHLLPQLAEATMGPTADSEFVAAVVRRTDRSPLFTSAPGARTDAARQGDVEMSLPFGGRPGPRGDAGRRMGGAFDGPRDWDGDRPRGRDDAPASPPGRARPRGARGRPAVAAGRHAPGRLARAGGGRRAPAQPRRRPRPAGAARRGRRRCSPPAPSARATWPGSSSSSSRASRTSSTRRSPRSARPARTSPTGSSRTRSRCGATAG